MFISLFVLKQKRNEPKKKIQDFSMQLDGKGSIILQADTKLKLFAPSR